MDYSITFSTDRSPAEVFAAINDVRSWWTGDIVGDTAELGDEFVYSHEDVHRSTQRISESVPGSRIVWHVVDAHLNFIADPAEWVGTDIVFDITSRGDQTEVRFSHIGLVPEVECYEACSSAWAYYVGSSLREFIGRSAASR